MLERDLVEDAIRTGSCVEFWRGRPYPAPTVLGVPIKVTDKLVFVSAVSEAARFDGFSIFEIDSISRLRHGTAELALLRESLGPPLELPFSVPGDAFLEVVLDRLVATAEPAAIHLEEGAEPVAVIGRPVRGDGQWLLMESWDPRGGRGETLIRLADVSLVEIRTDYLRARRTLGGGG